MNNTTKLALGMLAIYLLNPRYKNTASIGAVVCNDGTFSNKKGRGTCAYHNGVKQDKEQEKELFLQEMEVIKTKRFSNSIEGRFFLIMDMDVMEKFLRQIFTEEKIEINEKFITIFCGEKNNDIIGYYIHSVGGVAATSVDAKLILGMAVALNAKKILISHNHPSGNLNPSQADIEITRKLIAACDFLDIQLVGHLILTKDSYTNIFETGLL